MPLGLNVFSYFLKENERGENNQELGELTTEMEGKSVG